MVQAKIVAKPKHKRNIEKNYYLSQAHILVSW